MSSRRTELEDGNLASNVNANIKLVLLASNVNANVKLVLLASNVNANVKLALCVSICCCVNAVGQN